MKTTPALASIAVVLLVTPLHSGGIKKWIDEDGNITFGDAPPPYAVNMETIRQHAPEPAQPVAGSANSDYYSPQQQLRRMQKRNKQRDLERQQRANMARKEELSKQQAMIRRYNAEKEKQVSMARCSQYQARIKVYEHKTIQAYSNKSDRLSDESHLALLRKQEAKHCH